MDSINKQHGGKRAGAGRKKGSVKDPALKRSQRIIVLATPAQEQELKDRAEKAGMSVSAYLLSLAFN